MVYDKAFYAPRDPEFQTAICWGVSSTSATEVTHRHLLGSKSACDGTERPSQLLFHTRCELPRTVRWMGRLFRTQRGGGGEVSLPSAESCSRRATINNRRCIRAPGWGTNKIHPRYFSSRGFCHRIVTHNQPNYRGWGSSTPKNLRENLSYHFPLFPRTTFFWLKITEGSLKILSTLLCVFPVIFRVVFLSGFRVFLLSESPLQHLFVCCEFLPRITEYRVHVFICAL